MMMAEDLNLAGRLTIKKYTRDNRLVDEISVHNDITIDGRELVARLFNNDNANEAIRRVSKIRLGKSKDKFDYRQGDLVEPVIDTRTGKAWETDISTIEQSQVQDRIMLRLTGELGVNDCNEALQEAGLFTADGVMYNRVVFDTITKSDKFKLTLVWEITF
jgi:hypothetical protein